MIAGILERGSHITKNKDIKIILQPTTSPEHLRLFLCENGYEILSETPVFENGKSYSVMVVRYNAVCFDPESGYCFAGKVSTDSKAGVIYIEKQQKRCIQCSSALNNKPDKAEEFIYYNSALKFLNQLLSEK